MLIKEKVVFRTFAVISILLFIIIFFYFSLKLAKISLVEGPIEIETNLIQSSCQVYKNQYGVPHIIANENSEVFFGLGFVEASDRLWQMDYLRRIALGELSEIFGKEMIRIDQFFRCLELRKTAQRIIKSLEPNSLMILQSFSDGVNAYIDEFSNRLPLEFNTLGYKPKHWEPTDCIAIGRLMAFNMNFSFWLDLTFTDIANKIGFQKALELVPSSLFYPQTIVADKAKISIPPRTGDSPFISTLNSSILMELLSKNLLFPNTGGSNTWAVQTINNRNRSAILASDPHLSLQLPPIWYQAHITSKDINAVGLFLPGIPLPLIGRNDNIAWGITNVMLDDCDFFAFNLDSTGRFVIDPLGKKSRIRVVLDTIYVNNSTPVAFYRRYYGSDPIVSDFLLMKDTAISPSLFGFKPEVRKQNWVISYKWTGKNVSNEVRALYEIAKARNWEEFQRARNFWGVPALNFSYADRFGNIGIMPTGLFPFRKNVNPNFVNLISSNYSNWGDLKRLPKELSIFNPKTLYVFNANNPIVITQDFLTNYWNDPFRAVRLKKLLSEGLPEDILANQMLQKDVVSEQARHILNIALPILKSKSAYLNKLEKKALSKLSAWNFNYSSNAVEPSLSQMFIVKLIESTFKDELGESLYKQYVYLDFIPTRVIERMLLDSASIFFDDVRTDEVEDKAEIIFRSFKRAISDLRKIFSNDDISTWVYGVWHKVEIEHPFAKYTFLRPSFTSPKSPIGGNNSTINYSGGRLFEPGKVEIAPSARFLADMSDSIVWMILPGGNSGQNVSANFIDQFNLWLNGSYIPVPLGRVPSSRFHLFAKIVNPKSSN